MLRSVKLKSLNPHITCVLCGGYLVDATTIIECLHSFCRSCIIRWLQKSYHCPVCETEIHKTRPFLNIRPDRVLQDIVYKLVPGFYHNELQRRKDFEKAIKQNEDNQINSRDQVVIDEKKRLHLIEDPVCITLEYFGSNRNWKEETIFPTRFLRCSSKVPVHVLKKFVFTKNNIPRTHVAEVVRSDEILSDHLTLSEISRIYGLHTKSFIDLQYVFLSKNDTKYVEHHNQKNTNKQEQQMKYYRNAFYRDKNEITKKENEKKENRKNEIWRKDMNMEKMTQNGKILAKEKVDQHKCLMTPDSDDHDSMVAGLELESSNKALQLQAY